MRVIIIGADTGWFVSCAVCAKPTSASVYERDRTRRDGLQGYRVGIDPDGSRALTACLPTELFAITEPTTCFRLSIRTSAPIPQRSANNSTLLGNAIHTMTPGRGVGANTALSDAKLLCRKPHRRPRRSHRPPQLRDGNDQLRIRCGQEIARPNERRQPHTQTTHRPRRPHRHAHPQCASSTNLPPVRNRVAKAQRQYRGHDRDGWAAEGHTHVSETSEVRRLA